MHLITFEVDGKTIKRFSVDEIESSAYEGISMQSCGDIVSLDNGLLFLSGRSCNSLLVGVKYRSKGDLSVETNAPRPELIDSDDDQDLYEDDEKVKNVIVNEGSISFVKYDALVNNGPISSFTMGQYSSEKFIANLQNPSYNEVSIFAAGGIGSAGHMSIFTPTVQPVVKSSLRFSDINRLWIINNRYLITSDDPNKKSEIFDVDRSYARITAKHFINNELTVAMHELNGGNFILQVTPKRIILFNNKLKRVATLDEELKEFVDDDIINSVFNDEYLMIFFSSGEVVIYTINPSTKSFTKIELPKILSDTIITTGYIANSRLLAVVLKDISVLLNRGHKRKRDSIVSTSKLDDSVSAKLMVFVLVTGDNRIVVFGRFHNEKCFQLNSVNIFSDLLSLNFFNINGEDPDPFIKQVILNDLGDENCQEEYLTILTVGGEIYSYKLFFDGANFGFTKQYSLPITGAPFNAYAQGTSIERRMIHFNNVSGLRCIMVTGVVPYFITKSSHSQVKIFKFSKIPIVSFVPYSNDKIKNGLIYLDTKKNARIVELPRGFNYDNNWPMRKIHIGETIKSLAFHESSRTMVLSTFKEIPYSCLDEDGEPIAGLKKDKPSAISYVGKIQLLSTISWTVIDSIDLAENEVGVQVKSMILDVGSESKRFKSKKELILVGTGRYRMEDLGCNGSFKLYEIIDIIPEPGKPETNHKFKEVTHEDTKGAVSSICDVSGRFLVAQGQKIIVRDIKDNSAVCVAFMDASVYISETKSFGNLVLVGDTLKSVFLAGFDAEPFRMILLSKDLHEFDVSCADFLTKDEDIYILVADNDSMIHVLQYNPDDASSFNGQRLLLKSSFNTNLNATCMKSILKHEQLASWVDSLTMPFQTIASTVEGALYCVFPVSEATYRRMYILQQQLIDREFHPCGLNPKLNRAGCKPLEDSVQKLKPLLDCELIRRYSKMSQERMKTIGLKISIKNVAVDLWKDLIEFENVLNHL